MVPGVQGHGAEVEVGAQERGRPSIYLNRPAGVVSIGQNQVAGRAETGLNLDPLRLVGDNLGCRVSIVNGQLVPCGQDHLAGRIEGRIAQGGQGLFVVGDRPWRDARQRRGAERPGCGRS